MLEVSPSHGDKPFHGAFMNVAVIAVHGVADQQPFDSARKVAALLTDLDQNRKYPAFAEHKVQIPRADLQVESSGKETKAAIKDRPNYIDHHLRKGAPAEDNVDVSYELMRNQLVCYEPYVDARMYYPIRLYAETADRT